MKSSVFFADLRASHTENLLDKVGRLLANVKLEEKIADKALTAVKLHFGETGNLAYVRPVYVRKIIDAVIRAGGKPFLTDANTLYVGTRSDSVNHLITAIRNGFDYAVAGAPLVIADGLRGGSEIAVTVDLKRFKKVYIGSEIVRADAIVSVAHFKGHELSGFGGTIKNLGMGCASRRGKLAQHSTVSPKVDPKRCEGCGECVDRCAQHAILLVEEKAKIDPKKCVGCGECILICPNEAIKIRWNQQIPVFLENMVEYTIGVLKGKEGAATFLNFITDVSPACDCFGHNDTPIVGDIGIVASNDPVAIDQASADLVNNAQGRQDSALTRHLAPGEDKFRALYPNVDWEIQLAYGQKLGLGSREYDLIRV